MATESSSLQSTDRQCQAKCPSPKHLSRVWLSKECQVMFLRTFFGILKWWPEPWIIKEDSPISHHLMPHAWPPLQDWARRSDGKRRIHLRQHTPSLWIYFPEKIQQSRSSAETKINLPFRIQRCDMGKKIPRLGLVRPRAQRSFLFTGVSLALIMLGQPSSTLSFHGPAVSMFPPVVCFSIYF